ncbi:Crp/Fnr family transcriptional regulator [Draconibacterium orientale]|uniref:Crp/Fnr family transcriptional regulator n=1 Tax=Draconibacterium orientale TaxID=1168034 RepID=UPI002ABDF327|nr:Crp/Fnr family transcriptional regulator [Draconibacterium orientale]
MDAAAMVRNNIIPIETNEWGLDDLPLLRDLDENEMNLVKSNAVNKIYKKRINIYREGSRHAGVYILLNGIVKIYKIGSKGKQHILRFAQRGDIIAYRSLLSNELACSSAKAHDDNVIVSYVPHHIFLELLHRNRNFTQAIMKMICRELYDSNAIVTDFAQKRLRERTAKILLLLKKEFGVDFYNTLQIQVTRMDLANMIGTVTESLIRVLSEFRDEGLLDLSHKNIVFLDIQKLHRIANFSQYNHF